MTDRQTAPYGTWKSPISSDLIVSDVVQLSDPAIDGRDIYWTELRPTEGGRVVLVNRTPDGSTTDVTPPGFNVRTRVHEYGGAPFVVRNGTVWFSNYDDQRLYRQTIGTTPVPLTAEADLRWADGILDESRYRLIYIREDHTVAAPEPVNAIVGFGLDQASPEVVTSGCDFYSNPRLSPDGTQLAWLEWNHPNMPWDGTELCVAQLDDTGRVSKAERIAGSMNESVLQPLWSPDGMLYFISDR